MDRILSTLLLYSELPEDGIINELAAVSRELRSRQKSAEKLRYRNEDTGELRARALKAVRRILEVSTDFAFDENLWQCYLTLLIIMNENPFSLTCEKAGPKEGGSVNELAKGDFGAFRELFNYDFSELEGALGINCFSVLRNYRAIEKPRLMYNAAVSECVRALRIKLSAAENENEFFSAVTDFYRDFGVGMFGINRAFRLGNSEGGALELVPVSKPDEVRLSDLVGYESQKARLVENTEAFVSGKRANNVLLFGDSGTGKSTSIKAIVNEFYPRGLRMIEIYKHQFKDLSALIAKIKNRNYKFIIYMDDLSFEEFEADYKFLKAVIEGGVETKPENILIYATSNRRHLIKEVWSDRADIERHDEVHRSDTLEEKISLAQRFGLSIGYYKPKRAEYHEIVKALAKRAGLDLPEDELLAKADQWEMQGGGFSGRTARQFVDHLAGGHNQGA